MEFDDILDRLFNYFDVFTLQDLAKKMNVSKATMSRMINTFYEQGLTLDKGKCQLSKNRVLPWHPQNIPAPLSVPYPC